MPTTHIIADLVRQTTTTTGTGTLSMGTIPTGCQGVVAGVGNGKKARFRLAASDGSWQVFEGTVTDGSPDTVSRGTTYANSLGTTADISLPAGTHTLDLVFDAKSGNEATPRLLTINNGLTFTGGVLTIDFMGSCNVFAVLSQTANVTTVTPQNVPERASLYLESTQSGGPWTFPQNAWPSGTVLDGTYNLYTDSTKSRFWWTTTDSGVSSVLECNAPTVDPLPRTAEVVTVTGNTSIDSTYNGKIIDCNSGSSITLTLADALTAGFQCYALRRGAGAVIFARQTSGTLNGAASNVSISAQWRAAYVFAYGTGTFAVDAG